MGLVHGSIPGQCNRVCADDNTANGLSDAGAGTGP